MEMLADRMTPFRFIRFGLFTTPVSLTTELLARFISFTGLPDIAARIQHCIYPKDLNQANQHVSLGVGF